MLKVFSRVAVAAFLCSVSSQAIAQSAQWFVSEAKGPVSVLRKGERVAASRGTPVNAGDALVTGAGASAVLVHDKDFVTVAANSRIRIPEVQQASGLTRFIEDFGNAIFRIEKRGIPHFSVDTPYLAAVVKGTTFSVTVGVDSTSLQVTEGVVEVATLDGGARDLVRPGSIAMIAAGDRYRLNVSGDQPAIIDSPQRPPEMLANPSDAVVAPAAATEPADTAAPESKQPSSSPEAKVADAPRQAVALPKIETLIASKPVDLGKATNGIVTGSSPVILAAVLSTAKLPAKATPSAPKLPDATGDVAVSDAPTAVPPPANDAQHGGDTAAGTSAKNEPAAKGDKPTTDTPVDTSDAPAKDAPAAKDDTPATDKPAAKDDTPATDKPAAKDDKSGKDDTAKGDKPGKDDTAKGDKPGKDDAAKGDKPGKDDAAKGDKPGKDDAAKGDKPGKDDAAKGDKPGKDDAAKDDKSGKDDAAKGDKPGKDDAAKGDKPGKDDAAKDDKSGKDDAAKDDKSGKDDAAKDDKSGKDDAAKGDKPGKDDAAKDDKSGKDDAAKGDKPGKDDAKGDKPGKDDASKGDKPDKGDKGGKG